MTLPGFGNNLSLLNDGILVNARSSIEEAFQTVKYNHMKPFLTTLYIGQAESRIRNMIENIESNDIDSRVVLSGGLDRFQHDFKNTEFIMEIKDNAIDKTVGITGKIKSIELIDVTEPIMKDHTKMTIWLDVPKGSDPELLIDEIQFRGYFYLSGTINAELEGGKRYNNQSKTFSDIEVAIINDLTFTSMNFYYERQTLNPQELITILPF